MNTAPALLPTRPIRHDNSCAGQAFTPTGIGHALTVEALVQEQHLFHSLMDGLPDMIYFKDTQSRFIRINQASVNYFGQPDDTSLLGKTDFDFFSEEHARAAYEIEQEIIRTGQPMLNVEEKETWPDRPDTWVSTTKLPLRDETGKITGIIGISRDITGHKRAKMELDYERNLLRALMENSDDYIYFKDIHSRFIRCSARMAKLFQVQSSKELIGKSDHDYFSREHAGQAFEDEQQIIRTGEPLLGKIEKETWSDGRLSWVLTDKVPLRDEAGKIVGTFGISKDITAIKEAEAKVETLHRQLVDTSRLAGMSEVATSVLHNVGNVLNSVNVSSSLIAEKVGKSKVSSLTKVVALLQSHEQDLPGFFADNPKGKQLPGYLAGLATHLAEEQTEILHETRALANSIQHIKEVVSMQQGYARTFGVTELLPVTDLIEDALRLNLDALDRHGVKLVREFSPVPPVSVEKHKVLQILVNLIRNAKYACDDSERPDKQITLRIASGSGSVKISVEDNGIGIAPENLTRIFGHGFTTRKEGHGFGLHSGALAAKELGGTLKAFSEGAGKGAIFTLELPLKQAS